jgi:2-polyprenyl-3-methyl-5-hydroxy-6-metoxy-1,4-benzoquinol methylase
MTSFFMTSFDRHVAPKCDPVGVKTLPVPSHLARWREISKDPNDPRILAARRDYLKRIRVPAVQDRASYLSALAQGKKVLDVGVVEHCLDASLSEHWLHGKLCESAKLCVGVDILEEEVTLLRQRGYDVRNVDLTEVPLSEKFDVIIVGELIEHIAEPGKLLRNVSSMLEVDGLLALTTPNPWFINVLVKNLFGSQPFTDSADHVAWYDASTLYEIGQRCGLELFRYAGVQVNTARSVCGRILFSIAPILTALGMNQLLFAKTIVYEFKLASTKACR